MDLSNLKQTNHRQYWDLVASGKLSYSGSGALVWGNPVTNLFAESLLSGPNAPDYRSIAEPTNGSAPSQFAESGAYPKPWRSAAQKLQNANYTNVGPYAALIGWSTSDEDTICDFKNKEDNIKPYRLWGRFGVATSGPNSGQGAFFPQDWYSPSEGTYNAHYFNNYFSEQGNPLNPEWQLRKDWWGSITKKTIITRFENTGILCKIEVGYKFSDIGDADYFPGLDLGVYNDFSLDILVAMTALAAITRWL